MRLFSYIYKPILLSICIFSLSCSNSKKTPDGLSKVDENGIPVMIPLQQELPILKTSDFNKKKKEIAYFFNKKWSKNNDYISFLVAQNGQIIYENYLGYANKAKKEKIDASTPLHIASVSKVLTATAIMMLVDTEKIKLEQKVTEFIPHFPYPDVTILTLLNHRSGMRNYAYFTYDNNNWDKHKTLTNNNIIDVMISKDIKLESQTDTRFAYCNTNYAVLALIIEKVTGLNYPEAMQEMIFKPLGMKDTYVFEKDKDNGKSSRSYKGNMELAIEYLDGVYGDKNIFSTPRDLLKFDKARYSSNFLNPDLIKKIYTGYSNERKGTRNYGLGIRMIEHEKSEPFYYHNGWWHGNTSSFINLRKEKVTIIALSNKYTKKTYQTKKLASLFGNYPFKLGDDSAE